MVDVQFIHCSLLNKRTSAKCLIYVVYGDCDSYHRRLLWGGLQAISEGITDVPWCVLGDFNAVIDPSESCGRTTETTTMAEFREFINEAALVHLPFTGCPYTWHNCSEGSRSLWRRLDRVLVNEVWLAQWSHSSYLSVVPSTSNHSPLILLGSVRRPEWGVFRFDNFLARQSGKINATRAKQRVNQITNSGGTILTEVDQVAAEFVSFFQSLLGGSRQRRSLDLAFLQSQLKHTLSVDEANELLLPITQVEIKEAFFDISEDSAPGPDGYTWAFFKAAWPEIGNDIYAAVTEFFVSGRLLKQLNATMLVLIPKVQLPIRVSEFRPIACCNVVYKAISKILVRRMQ
ncbi:UNVERIFIED_CONTAM: hypothetical protein Slati_4603400 [Sesamum latifolium]|uniref:Uncharacterized protein n=1 Tax=Sesamum latifolium TaxID=2727402 RepID=A0AAW2S2X4_9LAMI